MSIVGTRLLRGLISNANLVPMATSMSTSTNTMNVTNVSSVNTSATGLPEGLIPQGNLMQMATNLTGTSTSGTTTSGSFTDTGFPSIARSPLTSVCSPLGVQLPQTARAKIVNSEFVDFSQLLEKMSTWARMKFPGCGAGGEGISVARVKVKRQHKFCPYMEICFFFLAFRQFTLSTSTWSSRNVEICPGGSHCRSTA